MYRGTTPTLYLELDTELELADKIAEMWVTFKTPSVEVTKTFSDILFDAEKNEITVTLTQDETLQFYKGNTEVQVRIRTTDGLAYATDIATLDVEKILKEGVI